MTAKPVALIVEDDAFQLMMAGELAEEAGLQPVMVANADETMSVLQARDDIQVLVTDVNMPGSMDGLDLARKVSDCWKAISIVVVSGHIPKNEARLPEHSHLFTKPYASQKMVSTLKALAFG